MNASNYSKIDQMSSNLENLRSKYVPGMGAAETRGGEIIRALDRLTYRFYNDGDKVDEGYGIETVNSSYRYLLGHLPSSLIDNLPNLTGWMDEKYEEILLAWWEAITKYLEEHKEVFEEVNHTDSRVMSEEEYEAVRRWEQGEEDDWYESDEEGW